MNLLKLVARLLRGGGRYGCSRTGPRQYLRGSHLHQGRGGDRLQVYQERLLVVKENVCLIYSNQFCNCK